LVGLIFGNIKFWRPIQAEGRQHLTEYQNGVKTTATDIDDIDTITA
jgi:hypothetical protein